MTQGTCQGGGLDRSFAAEIESVAAARRLLKRWLHALFGDDDRLIDDVVIAVSEACNNAVVHAYPASGSGRDGGEFRLVAEHRDATIRVTVSDAGGGMSPRSERPGLGLGLPLIATLADKVTIRPAEAGTGTVVAMLFLTGSPLA